MVKNMKEKHLWKHTDLPLLAKDDMPDILLVGNGINRPFNAESWKDLICNALSRNNSFIAYDDIKDMPATMQIVVATAKKLGSCSDGINDVRKETQKIAQRIRVENLVDDQPDLIKKFLSLPIDIILNTNYSNEFEMFAHNDASLHVFRSCQRRTKEVKGIEEQFRLFQYSSLGESYPDKKIWHIHGDISKPSSMVIGHYYYGKLLKQIEDRAAKCKRNYSIALKKGFPFKPESWVDYFLIGNVYISGLGMYLAEQDLWWLLSFKAMHFPKTKVYFYQTEQNMDKDVKKLLYAYGVELITDIPLSGNNYVQYYHKVIEDIEKHLKKRR